MEHRKRKGWNQLLLVYKRRKKAGRGEDSQSKFASRNKRKAIERELAERREEVEKVMAWGKKEMKRGSEEPKIIETWGNTADELRKQGRN